MKTMKLLIPLVLLAGLAAGAWFAGPELVGRVAFAVEEGQSRAARAELAQLAKHDRLSTLFRAVAKAVRPAVVEIRTKHAIFGRDMSPDMEEFLKRFGPDFKFHVQPRPKGLKKRLYPGLGSGVIIDAKNGYILTNHHVIRRAEAVEVVLADQRRFTPEWVRGDPQTDLAIVKIKPDKLLGAPLGDSEKMEVGDWVLAIGAPEGLRQTVTAGIISAKGRVTGARGYEDYLQTDAAINKGNSGGPLVNMRGEVIGINTLIVSRTGVNEGLGLAIPSEMARGIMDQLVKTGKVVRGFLGVRIQDLSDKAAKNLGLPDAEGVLVSQVMAATPAAKAKMRVEDVILAIDGRPTEDVRELRNVVAAIPPGKTVKVEVFRDGKKRTLPVTIGEQPKEIARGLDPAEPPDPADKAAEKLRFKVATLDEELAKKYGYTKGVDGVVIVAVEPDSDAAAQHLREGLVILKVQGKAVKTAEQFAKAAKDDRAGIRLLVADPKGEQRLVFLTPEK